MTTDEDLLRRQLAYADDHLPALDPEAVVGHARRHRRRRRLTATALVVLFVAGAAGTVVALRPAQQDTLRPGPVAAPPDPSPSSPLMDAAATDGDAVTACRERLDVGLPGGTDGWRMTVRTERTGAWVVNVWTDTPAGAPQPIGVPDYVCTVVPAGQGGSSARIVAVKPDIGTPGARR